MRARLVTDDYRRVGFTTVNSTIRFIVFQHRLFEREPLDEDEALYRERPSLVFVTEVER